MMRGVLREKLALQFFIWSRGGWRPCKWWGREAVICNWDWWNLSGLKSGVSSKKINMNTEQEQYFLSKITLSPSLLCCFSICLTLNDEWNVSYLQTHTQAYMLNYDIPKKPQHQCWYPSCYNYRLVFWIKMTNWVPLHLNLSRKHPFTETQET